MGSGDRSDDGVDPIERELSGGVSRWSGEGEVGGGNHDRRRALVESRCHLHFPLCQVQLTFVGAGIR